VHGLVVVVMQRACKTSGVMRCAEWAT
jgi:hypothetical protein